MFRLRRIGDRKILSPQRRTFVTKLDEGRRLSIKDLVFSAETQKFERGKFEVSGYVQSIRKQKKVVFVAVRDGSCLQTLQAVLQPEHGRDLSIGEAITITGTLERCPAGAQQSHELRVTTAASLGENDANSCPIQKKYQSAQFLRTIPHLRPRLPSQAVLLNLRSKVTKYCQEYFDENGFVQAQPPLITSSDCEGAGEVFTVATNPGSQTDKGTSAECHFRTPKYLTVSAQLHLEALSQAVDRVWCLSPTFRAEQSDTARHLSEFYMLEAELSFVKDVNEVMDVTEQMIRHVTNQIINDTGLFTDLLGRLALSQNPDAEPLDEPVIDRAALEARWQATGSGKPWLRITYDDAFTALATAAKHGEASFTNAPDYEAGFHSEHEKFLAEKLGGGAPIFIYNYPWEQKPFYMLPDEASGGKFAACFDIIAPDVCELAGGSLRQHRLDPLLAAMREKGLVTPDESSTSKATGGEGCSQETALDWYLDLRRYGSVPHGGFGIGFDRLLCFLAGVSNVRDMVTFPRYYGRCDA